MKTIDEILKHDKFTLNKYEPGVGGWGFLFLPGESNPATVAFSFGSTELYEGWEHVSMSLKKRYPTWNEMCLLKHLFFYEDEVVVQFYPDIKNNIYSNSLNLWKNKNLEFKIPPENYIIKKF